MYNIERADIDRMLGFSEGKQYKSMAKMERYDLRYEKTSETEERKEIIAQLKRIKEDKQICGTIERTQVWEDGWSENLDELKKTKSVESLAPKYFRPNCPSRLYRHFIRPVDQYFDYNLEKILKGCLLEEFIGGTDHVYEFGCGTCADLFDVGKCMPEKILHACDLTKAALEIATILNDDFGINIQETKQFDFTKPDKNYHLEESSAVYTFSALEQIDNRYIDFVDWLISEKPSVVIHLEPIAEFYNEEDLVDWIAKEFHEKRHYLNGYYTHLQKLSDQKSIEIIYKKRTEVGGWNHESNSIIVWKPI